MQLKVLSQKYFLFKLRHRDYNAKTTSTAREAYKAKYSYKFCRAWELKSKIAHS